MTPEKLSAWKCPISKMSGNDRRADDNIKISLAEKNSLEILILWECEGDVEQKLYGYIKDKLKL